MIQPESHTYIAIDLKSFYASVECAERGLNPLTTNLVVADESRTDKTICLAVSPSLKAYGISGRARLFEVKQRLREHLRHTGEKVDFIIAPPRMALYVAYSNRILDIYRNYFADEDMHVYSVDEVFMDVTHYIPSCYQMTPHELAMTIIRDVLRQTHITATAGIGTNMYLAKVAMDVLAKHIPADEDGVRIAELNEQTYREKLWNHKPITAFWRIGHGIASRLAPYGIDTMGKLARASVTNGEWLYSLFGINAELIIDHAWGYEPATMADIKSYHPDTHSLSHGQVLSEPYTFSKARTVICEMADAAAMELIAKHLRTDQLVLTISYDTSSLSDPAIHYTGEVTRDYYGREVPKHAHGTTNLGGYTSSMRAIISATDTLYRQIVNPTLLVRRLNLTMNHVITEEEAHRLANQPQQLDLFADTDVQQQSEQKQQREKRLQIAMLNIKNRFGKNALLKGINFAEGATAIQRNQQIGGHKA